MNTLIEIDGLASIRDLRARVLDLAIQAGNSKKPVRLRLIRPRMRHETLEREWQRALAVLSPALRQRLKLDIVGSEIEDDSESPPRIDLPKPVYLYEVLRHLLGAHASGRRIVTPKEIQEAVGASAPTVRTALQSLAAAGVLKIGARGAATAFRSSSVPWTSVLNAFGARPPIRYFGYLETQGRDASELLQRTKRLIASDESLALSGIAATRLYAPDLDLAGLPRLDLIARAADVDVLKFVHQLDELLVPNPNPIGPAKLAITFTHAIETGFRKFGGVRTGATGDLVLALEDARFYEAAHDLTLRRSGA
jgi:hypothetical protein